MDQGAFRDYTATEANTTGVEFVYNISIWPDQPCVALDVTKLQNKTSILDSAVSNVIFARFVQCYIGLPGLVIL